MSTFYDTTIRNSPAFRSESVCKDMNMLEPGTRAAVLALVADAGKGGHDLRVLETYRSQVRQGHLFAQHATQLRTVGCHGYGVAVDFGVFVNGRYQESNTPYVFLRDLSRRHGLISGQDWGHAREGSFVDSGHVQRVPVWRQSALFAGSWYPDLVYDPYQDSAAHGHTDVVASLGGSAPAKPAPAPAVASPAAAPAKSGTRRGIVNTLSLNVRKGAGTGSPIITHLVHGTSVTITGETMVGSDKWYAIPTGFVAARYIDVVTWGDIATQTDRSII